MSVPLRSEGQVSLELTGEWLLLSSLIGFFCGAAALGALLLAVTVHELGHLLLILAQGELPLALRLEAGGLCLRCREEGLRDGQALLRLLAGPLAGLLLWLLLRRTALPFLRLSGELSLRLSLLNLLPASCLDGGSALFHINSSLFDPDVAAKLARWLDRGCLLLALVLGLQSGWPWLLWGLWVLRCTRH